MPMQATPSGAGGQPGRSGLARFRSAPATWLEALLEDDGDEEDPLKQDHCLSVTQLLAAGNADPPPPPPPPARTSPSDLFLLRQSSSPADFLGADSDGCFSNYGMPAADLGYLSPGIDVSPSRKRHRDGELQSLHHFSVNYSSQHPKMEQLSGGEMENLFDDSMSFKVRAKRGCATHPRSIAERVRRTRISDRIRKLQELVPNMDKQTNTSDMLDEAVEYVKLLQKQIQELSESQKNCRCIERE